MTPVAGEEDYFYDDEEEEEEGEEWENDGDREEEWDSIVMDIDGADEYCFPDITSAGSSSSNVTDNQVSASLDQIFSMETGLLVPFDQKMIKVDVSYQSEVRRRWDAMEKEILSGEKEGEREKGDVVEFLRNDMNWLFDS